MWCITCIFPDGVNFFCGLGEINGLKLTEWDTDKKYLFPFAKYKEAKKILKYVVSVKGSETAKIELINKFSKS